MIAIGDKVQFYPYKDICGTGIDVIRGITAGTVVMVNEKHRWFSVEYGEHKQRTSFNFYDIGKTVKVCK